MRPGELRAVPGVRESMLDAAAVAELPEHAPPAPWDCGCDGIVWWSRGGPAAAAAPAAGVHVGARALGVVGGFLAYHDTPVGEYREVFGAVGLQRGRRLVGSVPFMAVDSPASLVGGRHNWSLPKSLAEFTGSPTTGEMTAAGDGWQVRVTARPIAPALPVRLAGALAQRWPDGAVRTAVLRGRGRARLAIVQVEADSDGGLAGWLRPGRHLGVLLRAARFTLPIPR